MAGWIALWGQPTQLEGQDSLAAVRIHSTPAPLDEGKLGWLTLETDSGVAVTSAEVAGEPLHLREVREGEYRAMLGVPVESGESLAVSIRLLRAEQSESLVVSVPVRPSDYPREVLTVPPAFVRPDSISAIRIQSEIAQSHEVSRRSHQRPQLWRGQFLLPRRSRITSRFGTARVYNGAVQSRHLGTDFAGAIGAPVLTAGDGIVALVADFYLAGRAIYIDHGAGLVTAYFHLSRANVRQGQRVRAGQRIGLVGKSGRVTGPHLHWVARYGTISIDPMSLPGIGGNSSDSELRPRDSAGPP